MKKIVKQAFVLPVIVIAAVALVVFKVKSRPPMEHEEAKYPVRSVEVITAKNLPFRARATAYGNVEPAVMVEAKSEVSGKVSYIHPALRQGGSIAKNVVVLRIDPTTFEFSLDQSKAGLSNSESLLKQLQVEEISTRSSLQIAKKNLLVGQKEVDRLTTIWKKDLIARSVVDVEEQKVLQLRQQVEDLQGKLATYDSRKAATNAQIDQSKTQLAQSQDTLGRTEVYMPFDARIGKVSVEKDEFVSVGNMLFEALGTKAIEINALMPTRQFRPLLMGISDNAINLQTPEKLQQTLQRLQLQANIRLVGHENSMAHWQGKLLRIGESVDPTRDMIGVVVAVENPYENVVPGKRPPLLKGMYAAVEFFAPARDMLVLPRKAIHQGRVYVANKDNKLEIREVTILHKQGQLVVIDGGVTEGESIVISDVIPVINGLPLKPVVADAYQVQLAHEALADDLMSGTVQ